MRAPPNVAFVSVFALLFAAALAACPPRQRRLPTKPPPSPPPAVAPASMEPLHAVLFKRADLALERSDLVSAAKALRRILLTDPDSLEAWVLQAVIAAAREDATAQRLAWKRVERILVYRGKMRRFRLKRTLFAAAEHYLERSRRERARLFLDELWRNYSLDEAGARAQVMVVDVAARKRRWTEVIAACQQLSRIQPHNAAMPRCRRLIHHARRMLALPPMPTDATRWRWLSPKPQGNPLWGVWVGPRSEVYAVGSGGTILRFFRGRFTLATSGTRWALRAIDGCRGGDLYAVGDGGVVLRRAAGRWRVLRPGRSDRSDLYGVGCSPAGDVLAVGQRGLLLSRRGDRWIETKIARVSLRAIRWAGDKTLLAAGDEGTLLVSADGRSWRAATSDSYEDLYGVWAGPDGRATLVGRKRTIVAYSGGAAKESVVGMADLFGVWGRGRRIWSVGANGTIHASTDHGKSWRVERKVTSLDLHAVAGRGSSVWAVGDGGAVLRRRGRGWAVVSGGTREALVAVGVVAERTEAIGAFGTLLTQRRGKWVRQNLPIVGRYLALFTDAARFVATGRGGLIVLREGRSYRRLKTGVFEDLHAVWGYRTGLVAVGDRGRLLRVEKGTVIVDPSPTGLGLRGVSGRSRKDIVAVGQRGVIVRFDGRRWRREPSGTLADLLAVDVSGPDDVVVGEGGVVLRKAPGRRRWALSRAAISQPLVGVWRQRADSIYAISAQGAVVHFDGEAWKIQHSPATCLRAISGSAALGPRVVGCHAAILALEK